MHSCSEQECYGRSGFCDCDGDYEYDDKTAMDTGDHAYTCGDTNPNNAKGTDRYARCGRYVNSDRTNYSARKAFRNVLCNQVCNNYNCSYELYQNKDCQSNDAFDNFILYGATKYGDFPVQYVPNNYQTSKDPMDCQYVDAGTAEICKGQNGAWRSIPQVCDSGFGPDGKTGPWNFQSVKIRVRNGASAEGCKVTIFDKDDQQGNSVTIQWDPNGTQGDQCIPLDRSKGKPKPLTNTKSAFSVEKCYTTTCTKKYTNAEWDALNANYPNQPQYRLAGRGVLWNDCVNFRATYKEFCQDYGIKQGKPMKPGEVCQLWDGAFSVNQSATDINQNIIKNSTVQSEELYKKFSCVIVDVCNLPPTHVVQNDEWSVR